MGSVVPSIVPRACEERATLERSHRLAEEVFDTARAAIRKRVGKCSKEEYQSLDRATDAAWESLQRARKALHVHIDEHGCGLDEPVAHLPKRRIW